MDTQTTGSGDDQGTNSSDEVLGAGVKPAPQKNSSMNMPSLPKKSSVEPPADLPFVDDVSIDEKEPVVEKPVKEVPVVMKNVPKIVPGVRGPLPSAPTNPMKSTNAKFGIGTSLRGSGVNNEVKKPNEPVLVPMKPGEVELDIDDELDVEGDAMKSEPEARATLSASRPKIGVPRPPVAPESAVEKEIEDLLNKSSKNESSGKDSKNVPPPTAPPAGNVDRNIRPRRLAIVVIVLLLFIAAIFLSLWYFFTRDTTPSATPQPTDSSLFSPEPTAGTLLATPTPSANVVLPVDSDGDGLTDAQEIQLGTDPNKADTDGDGYTDKQEIDAGYDPLVSGGKLDSDRDGLADPDEKCWGTDARNPDTDGDGYLDGQEVVNGYDPLVPSPNDKLTGPARCKI